MNAEIQLKPTGLPGVVVAEATRTRHVFVRHSHDFFVIGLFTKGGQASRYGLRDFEVEAGDVVVLPPGEVHDGRPTGGLKHPRSRSYAMAYISPRAFDELTRSVSTHGDSQAQGLLVLRQDKLVARSAAVFLQLLSRADGLTDELILAFGDLTNRVGRSKPSSVAPALAVRIRERMDDGTEGVADLCDEFGLSRYALLRCFRAAYGLTPSDYRRQKRIERTLVLIAGRQPLTEIAFACGFTDQSHFIRDFKAVFGATPSAYRRALG